MPAWVIKLLAALMPDLKGVIKLLFVGFLLPFAVLYLIVFMPLISYESVPLILPSQVKIYIDAAEKVSQGKVGVDWRPLVAIDAVRFRQNFSKASPEKAEKLANMFIEEIEHTETYTDADGKEYTSSWTEYVLRRREEVESMLGLNAEDRERITRYLAFDLNSFRDVGADMPPGWQPVIKDFLWPVPGVYRITSKFGPRIDPVEGIDGQHDGLDIGAPEGTSVITPKKGKVIVASTLGLTTKGRYIIIRHEDGSETRYYHLNKVLVKDGQDVNAGDTIGLVGSTGKSTGPHLHYEIRMYGQAVDPLKFY